MTMRIFLNGVECEAPTIEVERRATEEAAWKERPFTPVDATARAAAKEQILDLAERGDLKSVVQAIRQAVELI